MRQTILAFALCALVSVLTIPGCASSSVKLTDRSDPYRDIELTEPDFIVVDRFAATPEEVQARTVFADIRGRAFDQREREQRFGEQFAAALQRELVAQLTDSGIRAHARDDAPRGTWRTGVIDGYFFNEQLLGFALRDRQFDARTVFMIREVEIGDVTADVRTRLTIDTMNAEAERIIDREARMLAQKIVDRVIMPAYQRRGWRM